MLRAALEHALAVGEGAMPGRNIKGRRAHALPPPPMFELPSPSVQPRPMSEVRDTLRPTDVGLSVAPDELGRHYLNTALEQGDSGLPPEEDEPLFGESDAEAFYAAFDLDGSEEDWERVLKATLRHGGLQRARAPRVRLPDEPVLTSDDLDVTDDAMHDASLLDHEAPEWGEVESPRVVAEDTHTHGRPRGGHAPKKGKRSRQTRG